MLNALNYLLKVRANGNSGAKEAFYFWIFLLNKREMVLKVVIFSWLFYSIFRWGYILNETLWLALSVLKFIAIYLQCLSFEKTAQDQQRGTTNNGITPCKGHTTCNFHKQKSTISRWVYGKWPLWSNSTKQYFLDETKCVSHEKFIVGWTSNPKPEQLRKKLFLTMHEPKYISRMITPVSYSDSLTEMFELSGIVS